MTFIKEEDFRYTSMEEEGLTWRKAVRMEGPSRLG